MTAGTDGGSRASTVDGGLTLIVEPDPRGHRFQAVANVVEVARRAGPVQLLTSIGATDTEAFDEYLTGIGLPVEERFSAIEPPTREMAHGVAEWARKTDVATVVVMDADQSLKRWWYVAAAEFRHLPRRPRVVFMLTRYPANLSLTDRVGWKLRLSKGALSLAAMATGTLHHVAGFAGREDMSRGWLVKRARDPAICTAHSRDRDTLRATLGLPADRRLVGIFGVISDRKNGPLVLDAIMASGVDADLLLAGGFQQDALDWLAGLPPERRSHVIARDAFLPNDTMDQLVASVDVVAIAMTNNGPSGIMGKALAAGVPVISAGSQVRDRELHATGGGVSAELTVAGFADGLRTLLAHGAPTRSSTVPEATAAEFAEALLGVSGRTATFSRRKG